MDFKFEDENYERKIVIPEELIGYWRIDNRRYEFRGNGRYYVHDLNVPYELADSGMTLIHNRTRYNRLFGDSSGLPGVWALEEEPSEEWNLRNDGTYTYHWPGFEYFGEYSYDQNNMSTSEMRAFISESAGIITFQPPYASSHSGKWIISEPKLTITFFSGTVEYNREI